MHGAVSDLHAFLSELLTGYQANHVLRGINRCMCVYVGMSMIGLIELGSNGRQTLQDRRDRGVKCRRTDEKRASNHTEHAALPTSYRNGTLMVVRRCRTDVTVASNAAGQTRKGCHTIQNMLYMYFISHQVQHNNTVQHRLKHTDYTMTKHKNRKKEKTVKT